MLPLVIRTRDGLIVIIGYDHAGYTNIPDAIHKESPENAADRTRHITADRFTFHCGHSTGENTLQYFRKSLKEKAVAPPGVGRELEF